MPRSAKAIIRIHRVDNPTALADDRRNWPEDFSHENGNYSCTCCLCHQHFIGHKRRVVCKLCSKAQKPQPKDCCCASYPVCMVAPACPRMLHGTDK